MTDESDVEGWLRLAKPGDPAARLQRQESGQPLKVSPTGKYRSRTYDVLKNVDGRPVIIDIHDGDTFTLMLDSAEEVGAFPALRVRGLFCPELGQTGGLAAWLFVAQLLRNASEIKVTTFGRSFARFVAEVIVDGVNIAQTVIAAGHGKATA